MNVIKYNKLRLIIKNYNYNHPKRQYALQYVGSSSIAFWQSSIALLYLPIALKAAALLQ